MRDGAVIVFVEVRYRRSASYGDAAASVTPQKQQRLLKGRSSVALPTEWEF
jgi:Predicted endonuclease distantly related to archaeal Holliday junction resolvase